jgi:hypothetical protein
VSVAADAVIAVLARYRYRIEPTGVQQGLLARTFGCVQSGPAGGTAALVDIVAVTTIGIETSEADAHT